MIKRPRVLALAIALIVVIVVLIAACGGDDDQSAASDTTSVESVDTSQDFVDEPDPPAEVTPEPAETTPAEPAKLPIVKVKGKALKRGDENKRVKQLQGALIYLCYLDEGSDDGTYGQKTKKAVQAFQLEMGLNGDGVAGRATIRAVNKQVKAGPVNCVAVAAGTSGEADSGDSAE